MGFCFYAPVRPINYCFYPVRTSCQWVCPVLLMCLFPSADASLLSMLPSANASVIWWIIILIFIAGMGGIAFCLLLEPSIMLMRPLHLLCQCYFSVNTPSCHFFLLLIDFYIDSWNCWDCVLSVIENISSVDASFTYVVSMLPIYKCPLLTMLPSVDILIYR